MNKLIYILFFLWYGVYASAQVGTFVVSTIAGNGLPGFSGDNGPAINAQLNNPYEIATDDNNNIYFADQQNHRIRKIDAQTKYISTIVDSTNSIINNNNFNPIYIEFANNSIYFNDGSIKLFKYDLISNSVSLVFDFAQNGSSLSYFTVKGDSIFYTTSSLNQINLLYNLSINPIIIQNYSSQISNTYQFNYGYILDLLIDNNGDVLVLNNGTSGKEVIKLNHTNYLAELVVNLNVMNYPEGIAVDFDNNIYIADQGNHQIYIYKNNSLSLFAGNGNQGFVDNTAQLSEFNAPVKIAIDNNKQIYIVDNGNHAIRVIKEDCTPANIPELTLATINFTDCPDNVIINVTNPDTNLNDNTDWVWYIDNCGGNQIHTGSTFTVNAHQPINLYVRGEGGCSNFGECGVLNFEGIDCTPNYTLSDIVTAFSPNDDGVNDTWFIDGVQPKTTVFIYNRWGDLIRKIENYDNVNNAWDGKSKIGELVQEGTYFYILENNNKKVAKGWVQVLH